MSKLRILCLHGFTSNGSVHAHQARHITKALSAEYDFIFPDAPHVVDISTQMNPSSPSTRAWTEYVAANSTTGHRAWWYSKDPYPPTNFPGGLEGLEQSLGFLASVIERTGPVHAIWGFSQGACFAGLLTALLSEKNVEHPLRRHLPKSQGSPMAGIFFSGFKTLFKEYESLYAAGIDVPTLHVMGEQDTAVSVDRSKLLVGICSRAKVLQHGGGHDIPKAEKDREFIVQFVRGNLKIDYRPS